MNIERRQFLLGGGALAAITAQPLMAADKDKDHSSVGKEDFSVGEPCLQAPAPTTMGISWAVSGLAKGVIELADNPAMRNATTHHAGGLGLRPIDTHALQVRLVGLKPSTRYWYRTVTTPFTSYRDVYKAKLGKPVQGGVHSFTTPGPDAEARFCVINDTHARWGSFEQIASKLKQLSPPLVVWNGDATNTTQDKATAVEIFLRPPIPSADYAADVPVSFVSGNHDYRGSWISRREEVVLPRHPAELPAAEDGLKWNFAVRMGELAVIGMDTGEDKPDTHPKFFGLANFGPYRRAQAKWLERALARPEIAAAKHKVVCCHIPLYAAPDTVDYPNDGTTVTPNGYAYWSRECFKSWNPVLERHGVELVVAAHVHAHRVDPPSKGRGWYQVTGGGHSCAPAGGGKPEQYPSVIEVTVQGGKLTVRVHDVAHGRVANELTISSRNRA